MQVAGNTKVKGVMSLPLLTINSTASVREAANIMTQNRVRHVLVIENNDISKPLGIVTPSDFAGYLRKLVYRRCKCKDIVTIYSRGVAKRLKGKRM